MGSPVSLGLGPRSPGFLSDRGGAAAAELALWLTLLILPVMSVIDIGFYVFQRMQVELAAQAAVQAIRRECYDSGVPVTQRCANVTSAATTAAQSTLLANGVTLSSGYPAEGYYCVNGSNTLVLVGSSGTVGSPPTKPNPYDCSGVVGGSTSSPSVYARVGVTYVYTPPFAGISVASLLQSPIVRTAWLRVE
jgi:Flp pilus assembly protein TadG